MASDKTFTFQTSEDRPPATPTERICSLLVDGQETGQVQLVAHSLFTQLDVLAHFEDGKRGWKQIARWLKYEETVETGDRWSKPHVPTAQLHALMELRRSFAEKRCTTGLGIPASNRGMNEIADAVTEVLKHERGLSEETTQKIKSIILLPHKHKDRKAVRSAQPHQNGSAVVNRGYSTDEDESPPYETVNATQSPQDDNKKKKMLRRRSGDGKDIAAVYHNYPQGARPDNLTPYKPNKHLTKKLPKDCESANLLVGQVGFLSETVMLFCRLEKETILADLTEVDVPSRFLFLVLGPTNGTNIWEFQELGRAMAALLSDKVFCDVAYRAKSAQDIIDGIDEFTDDLTVLPPSIWDPSVRLEPPGQTISMEKIMHRLDEEKRRPSGPTAPHQEEGAGEDESLIKTGKFFGGLIHDIRHRYKWYWSDIRDGLHIQAVSTIIFLFFACITPNVTFGGLLGQKTDGYMGTMETLLASAVCGVLFAAFAGQPMIIVGATGPLLVFESILFQLCKENGLDFGSFRFWIGAWVTLILLIMVAFDLSVLIRYITRFTEESFSVLISVIFIYEACAKVAEIADEDRVHTGAAREKEGYYYCVCQANSTTLDNSTKLGVKFLEGANSNNFTQFLVSEFTEGCVTTLGRVVVSHACMLKSDCLKKYHWTLDGTSCEELKIVEAVPDVFFLSLILFIGTFSLAIFFRIMRTSRYFPSVVRSTIADFAVIISIITFTGIDYAYGINTPKLDVPAEFVTTTGRPWLVNPMAVTYWWLTLLAGVPALLATILIFLDQQITAVIVNRKEHKLKKGHGYHLDLFVLAFLIIICSVLGLPWFVAATVRAITHTRTLFTESEVSLPGERPQIVGVREQRVTGIMIHALVGFSTLLTSVLKLIPMPVLYGVFLYMGVTSLTGVQFMDRIGILVMPIKYQPDYIYLRHVKTKIVHGFTLIQIVCFAIMWAVKTVKTIAIAFPIMLILLMFVRKLFDFVFTQSDLYWLDHLLPDQMRREKEDEEKKQQLRQKAEVKYLQPSSNEKYLPPLSNEYVNGFRGTDVEHEYDASKEDNFKF